MPRFLRTMLTVLILALVVIGGRAVSQENAQHAILSTLPVKWKTACTLHGCLMHTDVLRGDSGNPANPKDSREYVSVDVALDREGRKPAYIKFAVDPRATAAQKVFIAFVKATKSVSAWKLDLDENGAIAIPMERCEKWSCEARVLGGLTFDPATGKRIDLLEKLLSSDAIMILYTRGKLAYRTMILLSSFQSDYKHVMAVDLAPAQSPHSP